jgi:hypothetical protein
MMQPVHLKDVLWALTTALELGLLVQLIRARLLRSYPFFFAYLIFVVLQSAGIALLYRHEELRKETVWMIAWSTQAVVTILRSLTIVELIRKILARYAGIWALARRILLSVGLAVFGCALLLAKGQWQWVILNGVRGLELAMAAVIVAMLVFSRYYRLSIRPFQYSLATGFCLYSAFYVVNYSLLEKTLQQYADYWNFLGVLTFLASVLVWLISASRFAEVEFESPPAVIPVELYSKLSSELNERLSMLNQQLIQFLQSGDRRR